MVTHCVEPLSWSANALPPTQVSVEQVSPSLQSALVVQVAFATLLQLPPAHVSVVLALPSLQSALVAQHPFVGA
jgi:hypothetical protein